MKMHLVVLVLSTVRPSDGSLLFIKEPPKTVYVQNGNDLVLVWKYYNRTKPVEFSFITWEVFVRGVSWKRMIDENYDGTLITHPDLPARYSGRIEKRSQATLIIRNMTLEDSSEYQCVLTDVDAIKTVSAVNVIVTGPASLRVKYPRSELAGSAKFFCDAINVPNQNFTWMIIKEKHTEKIVSDARHSITSPGSGASELTIRNISTVDGGYYICNATVNEPNVVYGYLQIFQDMSYKPCPNLSYNVRTGRNDLALCCPVSGYPKPVVTWERNVTQLQKSENPLYFISKVVEEDFGNYTCTATDGKSFITSAVSVRDKITIVKTNLTVIKPT